MVAVMGREGGGGARTPNAFLQSVVMVGCDGGGTAAASPVVVWPCGRRREEVREGEKVRKEMKNIQIQYCIPI